MSEVGRIISLKGALYLSLPARLARELCVRAGQRWAIIHDGRTLAAAQIPIEEIVNRAMMHQVAKGRVVNDEG